MSAEERKVLALDGVKAARRCALELERVAEDRGPAEGLELEGLLRQARRLACVVQYLDCLRVGSEETWRHD